MRKLFLLLVFIGLGFFGFGQEKDAWTENFDSESGSGYSTGAITINGRDWLVKEAGNFDYANTSMSSPAFTINDDKSGAYITSPELNTCGRVSFDYAYKSGSSSNVFKLQKSTDGTNYSDLDTHTLGASSNETYVSYYYDVNDNSASVYIRILSDNQDAHLFIEDYEVTNYSGTSPTITLSESSLSGFSYIEGNGPSAEQSFTVEGTNLTANITLSPPTNYEISTVSGVSFTSGSITLTQSGGSVSTTPIYVRLKAGLLVGDYNNEDITAVSTGAISKTVTCSGRVGSVPVTSFPWTEDFENGGSIPTGWSNEHVSASVDWAYQNGGQGGNPAAAHGGSYNAIFYSTNKGDQTKLISPPLDLSGVIDPVLSFWHTQAEWSGDQDELRIYYKTSAGGSWTLIPGQTYTTSIIAWFQETGITLPNPSADYYIAFDGIADWGYGVCIDDVNVSADAPLPEPSNHASSFSATANGSAQIDLTWGDNDGGAQDAEGFLIVGKTGSAGFNVPSDGTELADDTDWNGGMFNVMVNHGVETYSVTGLDASTLYDFEIYPYTNSGSWIDYKHNGTIPTASATTGIAYDNDTDVIIDIPQVNAADISSLIDTDAEAVAVFAMSIDDSGSADGLPTKVTNIRVKPYSTNTADWTDHIQGVKLHDLASFITISGYNITDSYIDISIASGNLNVTDGTIRSVELYIYLNTNNLTDNAILSFKVDGNDHGFTADATGSGFASNFSFGGFNSQDFTIDVTATELSFIQDATNVTINTNMTPAPTVAFTDENRNIDFDYETADIEMTASGSTMSGTSIVAIAVNGLASFSDLQFSPAATGVTLEAEDKDDWMLVSATETSNAFDVLNVGADVFISEVVDPLNVSNAKYVELFNPTASAIDLSTGAYYLEKEGNGDGNLVAIALTGTIASNSTYICAYNDFVDPTPFEDEYGVIWDQESNTWSGNGNDAYYLYKGGSHSGGGTLIESYGVQNVNGTGEAWNYKNSHAVRKRDIISPNSTWTASEWVIFKANADQMTPGQHAQTLTWQGVNADWNTKGSNNWAGSFTEYVPDASDNVTIASAANDPTISEFAACNNLTVESGAGITVNAGQGFTVVGALSNFCQGSLILNSNGTSGPSSLIHNVNSVPATVYSYFEDLNKWYLVSPPISDATAYVFLGQFLDYWDEPNGVWVDITDENTALIPGKGYSLKKTGDQTATYSGSLNNGTIDISGLNYTSGTTYAGWNLVGNPYPSVLDVKELTFGLNFTAGASVWPHNGLNSSAYLNYSQGGGGNDEARYVQPGQGMMVQISSDNENLRFTNDARTHTGLALFDKSDQETNNNLESLRITVSGVGTTYDETYISFRDGASIGFDSYYDMHKLFGASSNPHIFSFINLEEGEKVSIQSIPQPVEGDIIHLGTRIGITGEYELKFSGLDSFADDQAFLLLDKKTSEIYEIRHTPYLSFYHENGDSENRFDLIFDMTTNINNSNLITYGFNVFVNNDRLYLSDVDNFDKKTRLEVYDILGQKLINTNIDEGLRGIPIDLPSAYYIIKLQSNDGIISKKLFIPKL